MTGEGLHTLRHMSSRIPPSLAWLVKRRRAVAGLLNVAMKRREQRQAAHEKHQQQNDTEIAALQRDLAALDQTIGLHEILIDTTKLGSTRVQLSPRLTEHGTMTRAILAALAQARPHAMTTYAVVSAVCMRCDLHPNADEYADIRYRVRHRLKVLVREGRVARLHAPYSNTEGLWRDAGVAKGPSTGQPAGHPVSTNPPTTPWESTFGPMSHPKGPTGRPIT